MRGRSMSTHRQGFALQPRQVEAFRAVMLTGSMTTAADYLGITQPAVSRLIRDFELEVDFDLFQRQGNLLVPTSEALLLSAEVDRLFAGLEQLAKSADDIRTLRTGSLKIAATPAISSRYLAKVLSSLIKEYSDVAISLQSVDALMVCELVARHQVDLGVGAHPREYPGVTWELLPPLDAVCVLPGTHRFADLEEIGYEHLQGESVIVRAGGSQLRALVETQLATRGVRYKSIIECNLATTMCAFAAERVGIAIVDPFTADAFKADGVVCLPLRPAVRYDYGLAFPAHRPRPQLVTAFTSMLTEAITRDFARPGAGGQSMPAQAVARRAKRRDTTGSSKEPTSKNRKVKASGRSRRKAGSPPES
jgi:DNA-binding transcriptional LysR family regulator